MRNNALGIDRTVYWYIGPKRCEGRIVDIYNRKADEGNSPDNERERVLLIATDDGRKVVKLESTVILHERNA